MQKALRMSDNTQPSAKNNKKAPKFNKKVGLQKGLCDILEKNGNYRAFRADGHDDKPRTLLHVDKKRNVCRMVLPDYVGAQLADFVQFERYEDEEIDHAACTRAVRRWGWTTKSLLEDWPGAIGFKSGTETCFARLPFDPEPVTDLAAECPIFAEILSRMTNAAAFCHRVAAIFDPHALRKQAVWLWGPTDGGKSFLQDLLMGLVGGLRAVADLGAKDLRGAHWKAPLVGKTLIMLREAPAEFISSDEFKALTGDKYHMINPKGSPQFAVKLSSLLFCCSNSMPEIPDDDALKNRLIVCRLAAIDQRRRLDENVLMKAALGEAPKFLGWCIAQYEKSGSKVAQNDQDGIDSLNEAIDEYDSPCQSVFDTYFKASPGSTLVTSSEFIRLCSSYRTPGVTEKKMRKFVAKKYGGHVVVVRLPGHGTQRFIANIACKLVPSVDS